MDPRRSMASKDPLRTVICVGNVDDTSLALPSVNQFSSGQQRVREQVQSVKRTRSRQFSSGSTSLSPTSPLCDSVFGDALKNQSSTGSGGGISFGKGFSRSLNLDRVTNRPRVISFPGPSVQRTVASSYHYGRRYGPPASRPVGRRNTSRSEPDLLWNRPQPSLPPPPQRYYSQQGVYRSERARSHYMSNGSAQTQVPFAVNGASQNKFNSHFICSQTDGPKVPVRSPVTEGPPRAKAESGANGVNGAAEMSMKEAVERLQSKDETCLSHAASYIQHHAFSDGKAREELVKLNGIPPLVNLLNCPHSQVRQTVSAALWNLSFKSDKVKEAVHRCDGITAAVDLLSDTDSVEIRKHVTGLLWNLSATDDLKPDLLKTALPVLIERVIKPYTSERNQDPDVFLQATACLKNLSSAKQNSRQTMRKCPGLVDAIVKYIEGCVEAEKPDDKSVENSVCILHNLTFQLEAEAPALFTRITALGKTVNRSDNQDESRSIGCFSSQNKPANHEYQFDFPVVEDPQPSGARWLFHSRTLQSYLSLIGSSQQEDTQEVCCGTLQNLTAHDTIVSTVMSQTIVQKLKGLSVISPLIRSTKINLQKSIVGLVGNLTKNRNLHAALARKALPELLGILSAGTSEANESDDTLAMTCQISNSLLNREPEMSKHLLNSSLITSLNELSRNQFFPKSSKAAGMLLYNLWSEKDLQSFLKKQGMSKSSFVNDVTTAAQRSFQVVQ